MVRSHTQELLAGPRPRATCDRCHTQKLRCVKTTDQERCLRCARHNTPCIFSPRTRRKIRRPGEEHSSADISSPLTLTASLDSPLSVAGLPNPTSPSTDTWSMDFSTLFPAANLSNESAPTVVNQDIEPLAISDAVRELADLNVRLYDHFSTLPAPLQSNNAIQAPSLQQSRLFAIDETFTLTSALITLLKRLHLFLNAHQASGPSIDQATTLLILSCYHRLLDIHESIARNIQSCSQNPQLPWPGEEPAVRLPPLQVGSYAPSQLQDTKPEKPLSLANVSMHMMVMLMLSSQLCEQLREIITDELEQVCSEQMPSLGMVGSSLHTHVSDMIVRGPSRIFDDKTRSDLDQRWRTLTDQLSNARQAVILFSAASI